MRRPTKAELAAAYRAVIRDLVGPDLKVLPVGINPSLWSGWSGLHFGRPTNRLWITLHEAGGSPTGTGALGVVVRAVLFF